jgi:hypothetical protein
MASAHVLELKDRTVPPKRPEFEVASIPDVVVGEVDRPLPFWVRLVRNVLAVRIMILLGLGLL